MKAKVFISQVSHKKDTKKRIDYWGLIFVGLIFTASISCFLFDTYQEQQGIKMNKNYVHQTFSKLDLDHYQKSQKEYTLL